MASASARIVVEELTLTLDDAETRALRFLTGLGTIHLTDYAEANAIKNGFSSVENAQKVAQRIFYAIVAATEPTDE